MSAASPNFMLLIGILGAFALAVLLSNAAAHDIRITVEAAGLTVIYTRDPALATELQESLDLEQWQLANAAETVSENFDGTQLVKALVNRVAKPFAFYRLQTSSPRQVTLAWDPAPDATVVGYLLRARRGDETNARRVDAGNKTTATITLPQDGGIYLLEVVSYTADGTQSEPSNGIKLITN